MIGYEAIDILQETLKESPFWKFVQPLFGGADVFDQQVAMDVATGTSSQEVVAESNGVRELMRTLDTIIKEQSVNEPTALVRTELGFDSYIDYLLRDLTDMQTAAEPLTRIDAAGIAFSDPVVFSSEQANEYSNTVTKAMRELEQIKLELEQMKQLGVEGGDARVDYANNVQERLAAAQESLAQAASSIRGPILSATA